MAITDRDLLQADATILAGVLILLSLFSSLDNIIYVSGFGRPLLALSIVPLAFCMILLVYGEYIPPKRLFVARALTITGLFYLGAIVMLIAGWPK